MSTPEEPASPEGPTWFEESPMRNWIYTDPAPDAMWRMPDPSGESRSQRLQREFFGDWSTEEQPDLRWMPDPSGESRSQRLQREFFGDWSTEEQPDLRWMSDPAAPVTTPLGDLISEKDFPLRVRKHREYYDTVFVIVGDRGGWIAEVHDERIAHWIVRTVNDHWTEKKAQEQS